jgi:hypothetical protein
MSRFFRKFAFACTALALMLLGTSNGVHADPILLSNTGVDGTGNVLSNGAVDGNYTVSFEGGSQYVGPSDYAVTSANGFPIGYWIGDDTKSTWISAEQNINGSTVANNGINAGGGYFDYVTTFSLPFDATLATITGQWAADNAGQIYLNGHLIGGSSSIPASAGYNAFNQWTQFSIASDFLRGTNTLTFQVYNVPQNYGNPEGVRVEMSGTYFASGGPSVNVSVPEPSSFALLGLGGIGLATSAFRRRQIVTAICKTHSPMRKIV